MRLFLRFFAGSPQCLDSIYKNKKQKKTESPQRFLDVATDTKRILIQSSRFNSTRSEDKRY